MEKIHITIQHKVQYTVHHANVMPNGIPFLRLIPIPATLLLWAIFYFIYRAVRGGPENRRALGRALVGLGLRPALRTMVLTAVGALNLVESAGRGFSRGRPMSSVGP